MRRINVRRDELYELVWSKPRTTIAKELGVSDVRVGKLCRDMNVPAPPRGFSANKECKRKRRKFAKPPLTYTVAERILVTAVVGRWQRSARPQASRLICCTTLVTSSPKQIRSRRQAACEPSSTP